MHQLEAAIILRKGTELRAAALATSIVDPLGMEQPQGKPFLSSESRNEVAVHASRRSTRRGALRRASHAHGQEPGNCRTAVERRPVDPRTAK